MSINPFDSYKGPAPWEDKRQKDIFEKSRFSPFETPDGGISSEGFSSENKLKTNHFDTKNKNILLKDFLYFNPEGLISHRKKKRRINNIVKKHLKKKYKVSVKAKEEIREVLIKPNDINISSREVKSQKNSTRKKVSNLLPKEYKFIKYEKVFINSLPEEKIGDMTYCSRTARKNLYRLGVDKKLVPVGPSAIATMKMYKDRDNIIDIFPNIPKGVNVIDLFVDSTSKYEHRAVAYQSGNSWYVLDPYSRLKSNSRDTTTPIPMQEYLDKKKILGAFPYEVNRSI